MDPIKSGFIHRFKDVFDELRNLLEFRVVGFISYSK